MLLGMIGLSSAMCFCGEMFYKLDYIDLPLPRLDIYLVSTIAAVYNSSSPMRFIPVKSQPLIIYYYYSIPYYIIY